MTPLVREVSGITPVDALAKLRGLPQCLLLESVLQQGELGRYSFLMADPPRSLLAPTGAPESLTRVAEELAAYRIEPAPELPPFQGGVAGLWSYDMAAWLEQIPSPRRREFAVPWMHVGVYDVVIAFDHQCGRQWVISQGYPATNTTDRISLAHLRMEKFLRLLDAPRPLESDAFRGSWQYERRPLEGLNATDFEQVSSNFSEPEYLQAVRRSIEYIHAGDIFQVNLSQRLVHPIICDPVTCYRQLRRSSPAPFAGYYDLGDHQIISASPERFLQVRDGLVEARPIKGTRRRSALPEADLFSAAELRGSPKDLAENVMIVDLMRNDLSRVCTDDSIEVRQLCGLETYEQVQHLVSSIHGRLAPHCTTIDLLRASFPGGSITGAPKVRAMEVIAELEPTSRGAYCGSLGYIGFDGAMDLSILIRTMTASAGWWQFPVGGGVVAQSDPRAEYAETWDKASGVLQTIRELKQV